jgi:hypothetical protein
VDAVRGNVGTTVSFALVAMLLTAFGPAYAGPLPIEAIPPAAGELTTLADLVVMLKSELRAEEQQLRADCNVLDIRDRLVEVRNRALRAVSRLGSLWLTGRLRSGTLAASEVLTRDLVGLIYEAQDAAVLARALAEVQEQVRRTPDGRERAQRGAAIRQPACPMQPVASSRRADRPVTGSRRGVDLNESESAGEGR